jgi:hypothetical protein
MDMLPRLHIYERDRIMTMSHEEHVYHLELAAMKTVAAALARLPDQRSRWRVLSWALDHFPSSEDSGFRGARSTPAGDVRFDTLADLFTVAEPRKESEKALVGAYWFQRHSPAGTFTAQEVNKGLKDLGHRVVNITGALDDLMRRAPKMVAQLEKSGKSRQARKTYRVTPEGARVVREMLGRGRS